MVDFLMDIKNARIIMAPVDGKKPRTKYQDFIVQVASSLLAEKVLTKRDLSMLFVDSGGPEGTRIAEVINPGYIARATGMDILAGDIGKVEILAWAGKPINHKELALAMARNNNARQRRTLIHE